MSPSTHTTGGHEKRCPVCGKLARVDPSIPPGDAPCPFCGSLLWFSPTNPALPPDRREWKAGADHYRSGVEAIGRQDWPRAMELLRQCVQHLPDNAMYRMLLRNCECMRLGDPSQSHGILQRKQLRKLRSQVQAARADNNWDGVDQAAENLLALDPWDVDSNEALGEAAEKRGFVDVAKFAYRSALQSAPDRDDLQEKLAELGDNFDP